MASDQTTSSSRGRSAETTKQAMLEAAHARFLKESYENVGMRDIAKDVGVDVALVSRYFGNKEELFRAVLEVGRKNEILPEGLTAADIPAYLSDVFLERDCERTQDEERLLIILRSASSPTAAKIVREALRRDVLTPMAERLGGTDPELRTSTLLAVWMGMTIMRTVIAVEPMHGCEADMKRKLRQLFENALAES